jgi:hypothetical protein
MTLDPTSGEGRYRRVAYRAGLCCSVFSIIFLLGICILEGFQEFYSYLPRWSGILPGTGFVGGFISGVVCLVAHFLGNRRSRLDRIAHEKAPQNVV